MSDSPHFLMLTALAEHALWAHVETGKQPTKCGCGHVFKLGESFVQHVLDAQLKALADSGYAVAKLEERYESKSYNGGAAHGVMLMRDEPFVLVRLESGTLS